MVKNRKCTPTIMLFFVLVCCSLAVLQTLQRNLDFMLLVCPDIVVSPNRGGGIVVGGGGGRIQLRKIAKNLWEIVENCGKL